MGELMKSIFAGIAIAIGAIIFLSLGNPFGAIFFSVGLYAILWYRLSLYTGKIGYISSGKQILKMLWIILGNLIGCCIILAFPGLGSAAATLVSAKLALPLWQVAVRAFICGILIFLAVDQFRERPYAPILCVPAFIFAGAEHSIADMCFILAAHAFTLEAIIFTFVVILSNALGSILFYQFKKKFLN